MSLKIYNGYKLPKMTMDELSGRMRAFNKTVLDICESLTYRWIADRATTFVDYYDLGKITSKDSIVKKWCFNGEINPLSATERYLYGLQRKSKMNMTRCPEVNYGFSATFISTKNKILALIFTERPEYEEAFQSLSFVEDYHYQNQTDRPDSISSTRWNKRRKDWKWIWNATPSQQGLTYEPIPVGWPINPFWNKERFEPYLPDIEKRLNGLVDDSLFRIFLKAKNNQVYISDIRGTVSAYFDYRIWAKGESVDDIRLSERERLRSLIRPIITFEDVANHIQLFPVQMRLPYESNEKLSIEF